MNLYKVTVLNYDDRDYDVYTDFIVVGSNIKEVLDAIYYHVCRETDENNNIYHKDIPFYLRSSNMHIETIGEFKPNENWNKKSIISYGYINA